MTLKAIQTRYAGCHFRSRQEARWAVFFDALGIPWEYEPEGVYVTNRISPWCSCGKVSSECGCAPPRRYLPDFWLPEQQLWVEVKGALTQSELEQLLNNAASLSSNDGGGCHDSGGHDLLLLGPIPRPLTGRVPALLHMHKGYLAAVPWTNWRGAPNFRCALAQAPGLSGIVDVACDSGEYFEAAKHLLSGMVPLPGRSHQLFDPAYEKARSARFEFGETA